MNKHVGKTFLFLSVAALGMGGLTGCGNKLVNDAHTLNIKFILKLKQPLTKSFKSIYIPKRTSMTYISVTPNLGRHMH